MQYSAARGVAEGAAQLPFGPDHRQTYQGVFGFFLSFELIKLVGMFIGDGYEIFTTQIQKGVAKLADGKLRNSIQTWLDQDLRRRFDGRILPVDMDIALEWGRVCDESEKKGMPLPVIDSLLAATATATSRNLALVTRNEKDFARYAIKILNPWNGT